jgi:hypothetical protein
MFKRKHPLTKRMFKVFLDKKFEGTWINSIYQKEHIIHANIHLPEHKERADLEKLLPNLQEEMKATAVKLGKTSGKNVEILFGMRELEKMDFSSSLLQMDTLQLRFPSAYGEHVLDFEDGASCHMLNGGVTRMGKTCFLLYLATTLFIQQEGRMKLYISSAKLKDYYPFEGIPQVKMSMTGKELKNHLMEIIGEYKIRNKLLYTPALKKATDAKSIRKLYPEQYHHFSPIFIIIDEYARFAKDKEIQDMVTEIVETAGFVNIHVILASQRPDASTVLKPRIRANLLCRMAFTTADKKNSEIILDREGAEKLGKVAGRGLLIDSDSHIVQVPYLDVVECDKLLEGYRNEESGKGHHNNGNTGEIQGSQPQPTSSLSLQGEQQSCERGEQSLETYDPQWLYHSNSEGKG